MPDQSKPVQFAVACTCFVMHVFWVAKSRKKKKKNFSMCGISVIVMLTEVSYILKV